MFPLNLTIDLASQRFVYPGDLGIGVRQLDFTKGNTYEIGLSFVSGYSGVSGFSPSGLSWNIVQPSYPETPLVSVSGVSSSSFSLFVGSPVLDYAIYNQSGAILESYVAFSGNGLNYNLGNVTTFLLNNPSLSPQNQYYPLNSNPSGYATSGQLGAYYPASNPSGFITGVNFTSYALTSSLNATGNALQGQIAALNLESGTFYPRTNPSGYIQSGGFRNFAYALPIGANSYFVPFSPAFQSSPTVTYALDIPPTGYSYTLATSGVTPSGFGVYLSSSIISSGYSLSVIARG